MDVSTSPPLSPVVGLVLPTAAADASVQPDPLTGPIPPAAAGRGVLDGSFAVLDAHAHADEGLLLTELARASRLAKTSARRLAEQLVTVGAVQCVEHRHYVGPRILRMGQRWRPDPLLWRFAQAPVRSLAVQSHAMASMRILHKHRLRYICAAAPYGHAYMPDPADPESFARTTTTPRVLYAATHRQCRVSGLVAPGE
jgi:DNA-binding IclR family transcriptional regulator